MMIKNVFLLVIFLVTLTLSGCQKSPEVSSSKTDSSSGIETASEIEAETSSEARVTSETESATGADLTTGPDPVTEAVPTADDEPTTETVPVTEAEPDTEADSGTEVNSGTESEPGTNAESTTKTEPDTNAESTTKTESTTEAESSLTIHDVAFIGDSRTLTMASGGGLEFRLIPDSAVFATWGGELIQESAKQNALAAGAADRDLAVFWYGINDVQSDPAQKYASRFRTNYEAIIDLYRNANPDSDIVILSILSTSVHEKDYYDGQEENIRTYNAELAALCAEEGYTYLDITALFTGDECLAPGDNIHFSKEWYETRFLPTVLGALEIQS